MTMLGLVLTPIIQLPKFPEDPMFVIAGVMSEFLVGLTIGLAVRLCRLPGFKSPVNCGE
ncbi:MAG: hypothetical protein U0361_03505 [Nitrospiraceae bacterium]